MHRVVRSACLLFLFVFAGSCNQYPVKSLLSSFNVRVTQELNNNTPVKLDILWVIDHSTSMCQEQNALAQGLKSFTDSLSLVAIDAQMAVVTIQQVPSPDSREIQKIGKFLSRSSAYFPTSCYESVPRPCLSPADCKASAYKFPHQHKCWANLPESNPGVGTSWPETFDPLSDQVNWACIGEKANKIENLNCSVNSECVAACTKDADCKYFLKEGESVGCEVRCVSGPAGSFCQRPPVSSYDDVCMEVSEPQGNDACPGKSFKKCTDLGVEKADGKYPCPRKDLPDLFRFCPPNAPDCTDTLAQFKCVSTVGAASSLEAGFEGAFRSAWEALSPDGINCPRDEAGKPTAECQYTRFVRKDAYLVIVFVSDDDDCSAAVDIPIGEPVVGAAKCRASNPNNKNCIKGLVSANEWPRCQVLGSRTGDNHWLNKAQSCTNVKVDGKNVTLVGQECDDYLAKAESNLQPKIDTRIAPVSFFVNAFKALKDDPARVIVAAITGDVTRNRPDGTPRTDFEMDCVRTNYYQARLAVGVGKPDAVPICSSPSGVAGFGSRYLQLTDAFGQNGVLRNLCDSADLGEALKGIAETILRRVVKVCLPHPKNKDDTILVRKTTKDGKVYEMTEGDQANQFKVAASPDCRSLKQVNEELAGKACKKTADCEAGLDCIDSVCQIYDDAIFFNQKLDPGDKVEVSYGADLGYGVPSK